MRNIVRFIASGLLLATVLTACTIEPSDLEETEEQYLETVEKELRPLRQSTEAFDRAYQNTTSRTRFLSGLEDIPFRRRIVRVFGELRKVRPPPRFFDDQRELLEALVAMAPVVRAAEELAAEKDFVKASTRYAHSYVLYQRALTEQSSRFCLVAATSAPERDLCDPVGILPGAAYGDRLQRVLARASAEFTPRGFLFVARTFSNNEVARYLQSIGPSLVDGVRDARDDIRKLVPPDEFASDQRVIEEYFADVTRLSDQIAEAARRRPERLRTLFPESQGLVQRAGNELSEDIRPAVAVWFFPSD